MKFFQKLFFIMVVALFAAPAAAEFPQKPITIIVPFPPGGSVDGVARVLAAELSSVTGKTFIVDNRGGGSGGVIGTSEVVRSTADGYTLLLDGSIHVVQPLINKNVPYNVLTDFSNIGLVAEGALVVSTNPTDKANNLGEFFAEVKQDPDNYNFATSGYGSAGHLAVEALKNEAGVDNEVIAYRGGGPALNDMIGGQVQLIADPMMSSLPHVKSGRLKALAVTSHERSPFTPEIPTVAESGMPALEMLAWYGLWGPKDMDPEAMAFLEKALSDTVKSEAFKKKLEVFGFEPAKNTGSKALAEYSVEEMNRYKAIIESSHISIE